jgi:two-component system, chemotaxis family, chemotaxis protein CheY
MKVLVVDDSRAIRGIISKHLVSLGFEVLEASGGVEALTQLKHLGRDDLVLLDWNMPEMNGFDVLRRIRTEREYDELRVMMVTTESEMNQVARALDAGANEYLMKPFNREALVEKLVLLGIDLGEAAA